MKKLIILGGTIEWHNDTVIGESIKYGGTWYGGIGV